MKYTLALLLLFVGCHKNVVSADYLTDGKPFISHGTSFGKCTGFCWKEAVFTPEASRFKLMAQNPQVRQQTCMGSISPAEWAALLKAVETGAFWQLAPVIGCPDCADNGAEWVEISPDGGRSHKVFFEYGKAPAVLKKLITQLQSLEKQFDSCQ